MLDQTRSNDKERDAQDERRRERFEWALAALASLLVIALVGYLAIITITDSGGAARLALSIEGVEQSRPGYVVVKLRNEGEASAAEVQIEGSLPDGEPAEATLAYSPARSDMRATLVFPRPVTPEEIILRVRGFSDP